MAHKRNPVDAVAAAAAVRLTLGSASVVMNAAQHEHQRAAGAWQVEWAAVPDTFRYAAGAVGRTRDSLTGLEVAVDRMRGNLAVTAVADDGINLGSSDAFIDRVLDLYRQVVAEPE